MNPDISTGKPRSVHTGGGQSIRVNDGHVALLAIRPALRFVGPIQLSFVGRGNTNNVFTWVLSSGANVVGGYNWVNLSSSMMEFSDHRFRSHKVSNELVLLSGVMSARQPVVEEVNVALAAGEPLLLSVKSNAGSSTFYRAFNWREH